jgi:cholest-4-en-3-one 26-monooxygenase
MPQTEAEEAGGRMMLMMDPPDHTRYRKLVNRGFTPRMIGQLEPHIRELSNNILNEALSKGEFDFVVDIAAELPLEVIAELIGVPSEDRHKIFEWSNRMIGSEDPEYMVKDEEVFQAQVEMFMYAQAIAEKRRADPQDDIITALLSAEVDGDSLSDMDFNLFFLLLSVAGNETTRNATSHFMRLMSEHPDQFELLKTDVDRLLPGAIEEALRFSPPVVAFRRTALTDTVIRGVAIAKGDKVVLSYPSANRDEEVFGEPDRFDIRRSPNHHLSFGIGEHFCLGANFARMQLRCILREVITRLPDIHLVKRPKFQRSNLIYGIRAMPVEFTPES